MNEFAHTADLGRAVVPGTDTAEPTALGALYDTNVARCVPGAGTTALKVLATPELACLLGDRDGDGDYWDVAWGDIDALGTRRVGNGPPAVLLPDGSRPWRTEDFVFSTQNAWGGAIEGFHEDREGALDGTLFSLEPAWQGPGWRVRLFLPERLVLKALGQLDDPFSDGVDVDAFTQDDVGNVYLSFRHDELVRGQLVGDEGVVVLPRTRLWLDARGDVVDVFPDAARIALDQPLVDAMVRHAAIAKASNAPVERLGDLQALEIDPAGGFFAPRETLPGQPEGLPHLLFNGQHLGATVLSTRDGGRLAELNNAPLGASPMNGTALGLAADSVKATHDLNGMLITRATRPQVCADVSAGEVPLAPGAMLEFAYGNLPPGGAVLLAFAMGPTLPGGQLVPRPAAPVRIYPSVVIDGPVLVLPAGVDVLGRVRACFAVDSPPGVPLWVVTQALDLGGGVLSAPAATWCPLP